MRSSALVCFAFALALPMLARADSRPTLLDDHAPDAPQVTLDVEVGLYVRSEDTSTWLSVPLVLSGSYRPIPAFEIELDWPLTWFTALPEGGSGFSDIESGNPFLAGYFVHAFEQGYLRIGGGFTVPIASIDVDLNGGLASLGDAIREVLPLSIAAGSRGFWDMWLYAPDQMALVVPMQIEVQKGALLLGGELTPAYAIAIDPVLQTENRFMLQVGGTLGARLSKVSLGARLQLAWFETTGDGSQVSIVPFVQGQLGKAGFMYALLVLPIDAPAGFTSDSDFVWGLYVGGGARF